MKTVIVSVVILLIIISAAVFLTKKAQTQPTYTGITTVPCQDYTKPVRQEFSFTISITIHGKPYPISPVIGQDFGKCLHEIYTNDPSGRVFVKANDDTMFTLGDFFDVWKKTFSATQLGEYQNGRIKVSVDGNSVSTIRDTPLSSNESIEITFP
ncbi:MAG: hypothetical protein ACREGI_00110 [Candidatus Levyibacteriota bacterium]